MLQGDSNLKPHHYTDVYRKPGNMMLKAFQQKLGHTIYVVCTLRKRTRALFVVLMRSRELMHITMPENVTKTTSPPETSPAPLRFGFEGVALNPYLYASLNESTYRQMILIATTCVMPTNASQPARESTESPKIRRQTDLYHLSVDAVLHWE